MVRKQISLPFVRREHDLHFKTCSFHDISRGYRLSGAWHWGRLSAVEANWVDGQSQTFCWWSLRKLELLAMLFCNFLVFFMCTKVIFTLHLYIRAAYHYDKKNIFK